MNACVDFALEHGLPGSLEPLARATGASVRMLLYHFETKDALLRLILKQARERQLVSFGELLQSREGEHYAATLGRAWSGMTGAKGQPYLRMFGQLREDTEQQLWPGFRRLATTDWLEPLEAGLRSIGRPELATLTLAVIRGLLLDLDATADTSRVDRAFYDYLSTLEATPHERPHRSE